MTPGMKWTMNSAITVAVTHLIGFPLMSWVKPEHMPNMNHTVYVITMVYLFLMMSSGYIMLFYSIYRVNTEPPAPLTPQPSTAKRPKRQSAHSHTHRARAKPRYSKATRARLKGRDPWHERLFEKALTTIFPYSFLAIFASPVVGFICGLVIMPTTSANMAFWLMLIPKCLFFGGLGGLVLIFLWLEIESRLIPNIDMTHEDIRFELEDNQIASWSDTDSRYGTATSSETTSESEGSSCDADTSSSECLYGTDE